MEYFGRIIKHYIILALERSGVHVDPDTYAELDDALIDLKQDIRRIVAEVIAEQEKN